MWAVAQVTGLPLGPPPLDKQTLADWCKTHRGSPLRNGDIVRFGGLECFVRKMRRRKLMEAVIRRYELQNEDRST